MALRFLLRQLQETRVKFCRALDIIPQMVQLRMMYTTEKMKTTWFPAQSRSKSTRLLCPANFHKGISISDIAPGFLRQSMFFYFSFFGWVLSTRASNRSYHQHTAVCMTTYSFIILRMFITNSKILQTELYYHKGTSIFGNILWLYYDTRMSTYSMYAYIPNIYTIQIVECMPVLRLGCLFFLFVLSFNSFVLMKRYTALRCCFRKQL